MKKQIVMLASLLLSLSLWLWNIPPAFFAPAVPELVWCGFLFLLLPSPSEFKRRISSAPVLIKISAAIFGLLYAVSLGRGLYEWATISRVHPLCLEMPGVVQRLECFFGAAADQNYAPRTLLTLSTGIFLFTAMVLIFGPKRRAILRAIQLAGVCFAFASYLAHLGVITVPAGRFDPVIGDRFCYFVGNPSWMAPLLAPSLLASLVFAIQGGRLWGMNLIAALPMLDVILRSQQRGGLVMVLLILVFVMLFVCRDFWTRIFRYAGVYKKSFTIILMSLAVTIILSLPLIWQFATTALQNLGFGARLSSAGFVSGERLIIWRAAWSEMQGSLLLGRGYASWYRSGASQVPKYGYAQYFDTAHNFFVQYAFEQGLLAASLWILGFSLIVVGLWRAAMPTRRWIVSSILVLFLPIMLTQEIDFLRSGFYLSMMAIGGAVSFGDDLTEKKDDSSSLFSWRFGRTVIAITLVASGLLLFGSFSTAGYQYEANAIYGYGPQVRWLRQNGRINFVSSKAKARGQYALYQVEKAYAEKLELTSTIMAQSNIIDIGEAKNQQSIFLPIAARSIFDPVDHYSLDAANIADGRQLGIMLRWPPFLTTMPVLKASGAQPADFSPFTDATGKGFWCGSVCSFELIACPVGRTRKIYAATGDAGKLTFDIESDVGRDPHVEINKEFRELPITMRQSLKISVNHFETEASQKYDKIIFIYGGMCN